MAGMFKFQDNKYKKFDVLGDKLEALVEKANSSDVMKNYDLGKLVHGNNAEDGDKLDDLFTNVNLFANATKFVDKYRSKSILSSSVKNFEKYAATT